MKIYIPQHTVCITLKDPSFVTPLIKHLLIFYENVTVQWDVINWRKLLPLARKLTS